MADTLGRVKAAVVRRQAVFSIGTEAFASKRLFHDVVDLFHIT